MTDAECYAIAFALFGKKNCEKCTVSNNTHIRKKKKRLSMHCLTENYSMMTKENWMTLCNKCHAILEWEDKRK